MRALLTTILIVVNLLGIRPTSAEVEQASAGHVDCLVSMPNGNVAPGWNPDNYFADEANTTVHDFYGNGTTFVHVGDHERFLALRDATGEGGWNKFVFYRLPRGADLVVVILPFGWNHVGEPARAEPSPGQEQFVYQVFGVWFPREGCWEVRAHSSGTILSIVVDVVFVDSWNPGPVAPVEVGPVA